MLGLGLGCPVQACLTPVIRHQEPLQAIVHHLPAHEAMAQHPEGTLEAIRRERRGRLGPAGGRKVCTSSDEGTTDGASGGDRTKSCCGGTGAKPYLITPSHYGLAHLQPRVWTRIRLALWTRTSSAYRGPGPGSGPDVRLGVMVGVTSHG